MAQPSFEKEIKAYLQHGVEQQPSAHRAMTEGEYGATYQEGFDFLGALVAQQGRAIVLIAHEIDELRRSIEAA